MPQVLTHCPLSGVLGLQAEAMEVKSTVDSTVQIHMNLLLYRMTIVNFTMSFNVQLRFLTSEVYTQ